jgi:hypothetical protein
MMMLASCSRPPLQFYLNGGDGDLNEVFEYTVCFAEVYCDA